MPYYYYYSHFGEEKLIKRLSKCLVTQQWEDSQPDLSGILLFSKTPSRHIVSNVEWLCYIKGYMETSKPLRLWTFYGLETPLSSRIKVSGVITNLLQSIWSFFFILLPLLCSFIFSGRSSFGGKTLFIILIIIKTWSQNCSVDKA